MTNAIRIKTFRSKTLQDAFQQIRTEFGPDASILDTKAARFGIFGRTRIEVTASSANHDGIVANRTPDSTDSFQEFNPPILTTPNVNELPASMDSDSADSTERLDYAEANGIAGGESVLSQLRKELVDAGIDLGIVTQWIAALHDTIHPGAAKDIWSLRSEVRGWIRDLVHVAPPHEEFDSRQRVIALIGPPGAGKSTTLAKIAANFSMEHGVAVGVLSTDSYRLGSNYLLQNYAGVLGWSFETAESTGHIAECIKNLSHCRVVLIDTRGCTPGDSESIEELNRLLAIVKPDETHLVISSTCNSHCFLRYELAFEALSPNRMILTRLDEAGGLGAFFSCLQCSSLPVSYLTDGQNIPSDLIQASAMRIAQQIMSIADF